MGIESAELSSTGRMQVLRVVPPIAQVASDWPTAITTPIESWSWNLHHDTRTTIYFSTHLATMNDRNCLRHIVDVVSRGEPRHLQQYRHQVFELKISETMILVDMYHTAIVQYIICVRESISSTIILNVSRVGVFEIQIWVLSHYEVACTSPSERGNS